MSRHTPHLILLAAVLTAVDAVQRSRFVRTHSDHLSEGQPHGSSGDPHNHATVPHRPVANPRLMRSAAKSPGRHPHNHHGVAPRSHHHGAAALSSPHSALYPILAHFSPLGDVTSIVEMTTPPPTILEEIRVDQDQDSSASDRLRPSTASTFIIQSSGKIDAEHAMLDAPKGAEPLVTKPATALAQVGQAPTLAPTLAPTVAPAVGAATLAPVTVAPVATGAPVVPAATVAPVAPAGATVAPVAGVTVAPVAAVPAAAAVAPAPAESSMGVFAVVFDVCMVVLLVASVAGGVALFTKWRAGRAPAGRLGGAGMGMDAADDAQVWKSAKARQSFSRQARLNNPLPITDSDDADSVSKSASGGAGAGSRSASSYRDRRGRTSLISKGSGLDSDAIRSQSQPDFYASQSSTPVLKPMSPEASEGGDAVNRAGSRRQRGGNPVGRSLSTGASSRSRAQRTETKVEGEKVASIDVV